MQCLCNDCYHAGNVQSTDKPVVKALKDDWKSFTDEEVHLKNNAEGSRKVLA